MKNTDKIIYFVSTGLITLLMLASSGMYIFNHDMIRETFTKLGYPAYIVYPLAFAKILGLIAIWSRKSKLLKEWAYAGFFFDFVLALAAHLAINDGEYLPALVAIPLLIISRIYDSKYYGA